MRQLLFLLLICPMALQAAPKVMTDIAPIHSLVARVMDGAGAPDLLLPPGADPHHYSLRPNDADALANADLVIWVGPGLTPWLAEPIATLAPSATQVPLLDVPNWTEIEVAAGDDEHDHDHDHDHGKIDPHGWLDPKVAYVWTQAIAQTLINADPANETLYAQNAADLLSDLDALTAEIAAQLDTTSGKYILPHEGYRYFEAQFGLQSTGAIAGIDANAPGPAHIAEMQELVRDDGVTCVFSDAEIGPRWAQVIGEAGPIKTAAIDGIGMNLTPGPDLYPTLLRNMATAFADCLS